MYEYETEIETDQFIGTVTIEYRVYPGEPMVRWLPDGSGYPGSPPEVEIAKVTVTGLSGGCWDKQRSEFGDWTKMIDDHFDHIVQQRMSDRLSLELELLENACEDY